MEYSKRELMPGFWAIEQDGVRSYLLIGTENAILIDTCFGGDILSVCRSLTANPITLLTTHSDPDHIGCDHQFENQYLHPAEFERYTSRSKNALKANEMWEGDIFTVGEYSLEVVLIPGHTPGSVAFLDRGNKFLISGDTVQNGSIYMFGEGRNLSAFLASVKKLETMHADGLFETVYAAHGDAGISADILPDHIRLAEALLNGESLLCSPAPEWLPDTVKAYSFGKANMFY